MQMAILSLSSRAQSRDPELQALRFRGGIPRLALGMTEIGAVVIAPLPRYNPRKLRP
jgi:hypothetical protein